MPHFVNTVPREKALRLIDRHRHPRLHAAVASIVVPDAEGLLNRGFPDAWIAGYRRFGDQFEEVFTEERIVRMPSDVTKALEQNLFDPWMVVGVLSPELPLSMQRIDEALRRPSDRISDDVPYKYLTGTKWPHELDKVVDWLYENDALARSLIPGAGIPWEPWFRVFSGIARGAWWNAEQTSVIIDHVPFEEARWLFCIPVLRDPENMVMHYRDNIPLELLS